jgi:hypothetical protein
LWVEAVPAEEIEENLTVQPGNLSSLTTEFGPPESFQLDPSGNLIFVNVPDAGQIAVVSHTSNQQVATWSTGELRANFPARARSGEKSRDLDLQTSRTSRSIRDAKRTESEWK